MINYLRSMNRMRLASQRKAMRMLVEPILRSKRATDTSKADSQLNAMLESADPWDESHYGYDDLSIWNRASKRASQLLELPALCVPGKRIAEAGCGDGMVSKLLQTYGHHVSLIDLEDWRHERCRDLNFVASALEDDLPLPKGEFDLVFSYNTFEHVNDPQIALRRIADLLAPGGMVYLEFSPLFNSPWGLHAYRSVPIPYSQFLFDEDRLMAKIKEIGIRDLGSDRTDLQPLNRWSAAQFDSLWKSCGLSIREAHAMRQYSSLNYVRRFPDSFYGRGLTWDELTTTAWRVCLVNQNS